MSDEIYERGYGVGARVRESVPASDRDLDLDAKAAARTARASGLQGPDRIQYLSAFLDGLTGRERR